MDHMVVVCLIVWEHSILFSIVSAQIYIPTNDVQMFSFLHTLVSVCHFLYFNDNWSNRHEVMP